MDAAHGAARERHIPLIVIPGPAPRPPALGLILVSALPPLPGRAPRTGGIGDGAFGHPPPRRADVYRPASLGANPYRRWHALPAKYW